MRAALPIAAAEPGGEYLLRMANVAPGILRRLLARHDLTRDAITKVEQIIQDFLRVVFLPYVGQCEVPAYIAQQAPRDLGPLRALAEAVRDQSADVHFIGAHYRSSLSIRGRRSAFASRPAAFAAQLDSRLGPLANALGELRVLPVFQQLWDAVYLEQYFRLCGVANTLSEWALHQPGRRPIAVLPAAAARRGSFALRALDGAEVPTIEVSREVSRQLLGDGDTTLLWRAIARAIEQTLDEERATFEDLAARSGEAPTTDTLRSRLRLIRRANGLSTRIVERSGLRSSLAARAAYVTGLVLYGGAQREVRRGLVELLGAGAPAGPPGWRPAEAALAEVATLVGVLQSLRFYQDCYGDGCITVPYALGPDAAAAPGGGADAGDAAAGRGGPGSVCSLTMFWDHPAGFHPVLPAIVHCTASLFNHALHEAKHATAGAAAAAVGPSPPSPLAHRLERESGHTLGATAIARILDVCEDLSRCLHEDEPRAFTFLLGSPEWLISDLSIEHELVGAPVPFRLTARGQDPAAYASTLSLLEGNSSFLQSDDLAVFVAWPGEPLEATHIVRLPPLAAARRKLLARFTAGRRGLLAVVTHGNGRGEVLYEGCVRGLLRGGRAWKDESPGYERFETALLDSLVKVVDGDGMHAMRSVLLPTIRDVSEAPRVGALFVVAKEGAIARLLAASSRLTDVLESVDGQRLGEMSPDLLFQLARDDGATLLCGHTLRVWGRRHLPSTALGGLEAHWKAKGDPLEWEQWYKTKTWGTRRWTGLAVSHDLQADGLVIAVSADGPVNVLVGGRGTAEYRE